MPLTISEYLPAMMIVPFCAGDAAHVLVRERERDEY